jgi:uncharacterized DUF497 family protein
MSWTWDPNKAAANLAKHGVSFEIAQLVFDDPRFLSKADWHPDGDRYQTLGKVGPALLLVVHTLTDDDDAGGQIISARKATRRERKAYEEEDF